MYNRKSGFPFKIAIVICIQLGWNIISGQINCHLGTLKTDENQDVAASVIQDDYMCQCPKLCTVRSGHFISNTTQNISHTTEKFSGKFCQLFLKSDPKNEIGASKENHHGVADAWCGAGGLCDRQNVKKNTWQWVNTGDSNSSAVKQGVAGMVYCCDTDYCNDKSKIDKVSLPQVMCPVGSGNLTTCIADSCLTIHSNSTNGNDVTHTCDTQNLCWLHQISNNECKELVANDHSTQKYCCVAGTPVKTSAVPMVPMKPPYINNHYKWKMTGGIIASIILAVLLSTLSVMIIRKCRTEKQERLSYTYAQLTADLSAEDKDTDDEYMLIG